jgi:hypothetical protein
MNINIKNMIEALKQNKNLIRKFAVIISWLLSLMGISVGYYGCAAYGPAGNNEEIRQLNDLKEETINIERENKNTEKEISKLEKEVEKKEEALKKLQAEKDTLEILIQNNEK